ncbi:unnamed protein product [Blepharisma stoltei]|uniref:TmcB/TmcC TPR repeats domain-containing protein n=1 Tax=Blepharisma stoltei TaxID=1481888 RepID=A0AAU9IRK4_9CILI|nr:unnamed protein product [Blepharisma stoltei]
MYSFIKIYKKLMSGDLNIAEKENIDIQGFLSQSLFSNKVKEYLYGFFGQLFKTKYSDKIKFRMQIFYEVVINIIIVLQLSPLWWSPAMKAAGWSSYIDFWQIIAYASYDEICAYFDIMDFCLYGTIFLICSCLSSFAAFWLYIYMRKDVPLIISILPRKFAMLLTTVCIIPSSMMFVMVIKYSTVDISIIQEYTGGISSSVYQYGPLGVFLGLFHIFALLFVNCFAEAFTCDIRHTHSKKNLKARSCAWFDLERRVYYVSMTILYVIFGNSDYSFAFQIAVFFLSFILYLRIIYSMQYFNTIENSIQACKMVTVSSSILFFIFAIIVDNAEILMFLTVILTPVLLYFTIRIIRRRYKNLPNLHKNPKNQYEFEKTFRHLLAEGNPDDKLEVLSLFLGYWRESHFIKDKLFVTWEFNFCLYTLKDERLARVKLSKIANAKSSFEGDVQEWRLFNWLVRKKHALFADTDYLEYLKNFSRIKNQDEELCFILAELQGEFSLRLPRIEKLVNLTKRAAQHIFYISDGYKNLLEKHQNPEAFDIYSSYLDDMLNDNEEANFILRKKNSINFSNRHDANNLKNYGKDLATILVSCSDDFFGRIVHINDKASQFLKTSIGNILGSSIINFIPQPFDAKHENNMKRFIAECQSIDIPCHEKLFLQNFGGFLFECNMLITLTAFHNCSYFLVSFKPRPVIRELAITTHEGTIIAHTEMFSFYLEYQGRHLKNKNISDIIPMLSIEKMHDFEPWLIPFRNTELILVKIKKQMLSTTLSIVMIIHDEKEIFKWKNGQHHEAIAQFGTFQMFEDEESSFLTVDNLKKSEMKFHTLSTLSAIAKSFDKNETESVGMLNVNSQEKIEEESVQYEKKSENSDNFSKVSVTKKNKNILASTAQQLISDSVKKIRILQWVLFLIVRNI